MPFGVSPETALSMARQVIDITASPLVEKIVGVSVGLFIAAYLVPMALIAVAGQESNMTAGGVNASLITLTVIVLPLIAVVALVIYFLGHE